jgi:hypothetical protein
MHHVFEVFSCGPAADHQRRRYGPAAGANTGEQQTARLTPAQIKQNADMEQGGLQVAALVDQGKLGDIWDGATPAVKRLITRDAFISQISADRKTVGRLVSRSLAGLSYSQSNGKSSPAGLYANVAFASKFANEKQPVRELVSFHYDEDKIWRVSGYTLR